MIFEQEELDWETYALYDLIDEDLTYHSPSLPLTLGERAFEIALARKIESGEEESAWFDRHHSTPITDLPTTWPQDYKGLVQRRLDAIESMPFINLLERPENKRRWATTGWDAQVKEAAQSAILDRLEAPDLWRDGEGPITRSVAQLADLVRNDETLRELLEVLAGSTSVDLVPALTKLFADEAVPHIAAQRYKPAGVEKFREWQHVWDLQRAEDRGEDVVIAVPPKYAPTDFLKVTYWKARGKLDVPKERFIAYPGAAGSEADTTPVLGWAGWDHAEQGIALSRLIGLQSALGAERESLIPLLAGLHELEPWLHQWHAEVDASFGVSPASAISGLLDGELGRIAATRGDLVAWRPPAATRGRRAATPASPKQPDPGDSSHD